MVMQDRSSFGAHLRRLRLAALLSQEALAARAGLSVDAIRALESGRRLNPRLDTLTALVAALELGPDQRATLIAAARAYSEAVPGPDQHAPGTLAATRSTPLPIPPTELIGRTQEVETIWALLQEGVRLLSLVGPGGVGKTRLALMVAAAWQEIAPDGVTFVDLSALRDPALVLGTLAQGLGVRGGDGPDLLPLLAAQMPARPHLLVLDNFEQVVEAAPRIADLLSCCPHLVLLVTSRTPLHLRVERRFPVGPLATPDVALLRERSGSTGEQGLETAARSPAVQLFVARARAVQPAFALTGENADTIAEICVQLDGLPLALELAAARSGLFSPEALRQRLEQRLPLPGRGPRDLPERQQTLHATLEWSYTLLQPPQQALFRRLGVFAGGATLEAITAICQIEAGAANPTTPTVLEVLAPLVALHLVRQEPASVSAPAYSGPQAEGDTEPRFGLLNTIRAYALEQLDRSGEAEDVRGRHARYFLAMAGATEVPWEGAAHAAWLARLEREQNNLRAALAWTLERGEVPPSLQQGTALWRYWHLHGHLSEARAWLERLLSTDEQAQVESSLHSVSGSDDGGAARATALAAAAWVAQAQGDFARARALLDERLAWHRARGQSEGLTDLLINGALLATLQGDHERARALLEESLALHRAAGNRASIGAGGLGLSLLRLGLVRRNQGAYAEARALYAECLALHRTLGDREGSALALLGLGDVARDEGAAAQAVAYCAESLRLFEDLGMAWGRGFALNNLAVVAHHEGEREQALAYATESVDVFRHLGEPMSLAEALTTLGRIRRASGDLTQARAALAESLRLAWACGPRWCVAADLEEVAGLVITQGQGDAGAQLLGAAAALRRVMGAPLPPSLRAGHEQSVIAARTILGAQGFEHAWVAGQELPLARAVTMALDLA